MNAKKTHNSAKAIAATSAKMMTIAALADTHAPMAQLAKMAFALSRPTNASMAMSPQKSTTSRSKHIA